MWVIIFILEDSFEFFNFLFLLVMWNDSNKIFKMCSLFMNIRDIC